MRFNLDGNERIWKFIESIRMRVMDLSIMEPLISVDIQCNQTQKYVSLLNEINMRAQKHVHDPGARKTSQ